MDSTVFQSVFRQWPYFLFVTGNESLTFRKKQETRKYCQT